MGNLSLATTEFEAGVKGILVGVAVTFFGLGVLAAAVVIYLI